MTRAQQPAVYLHGTTGPEQSRLARMNTLLNEIALREMDLQPGQKVLDVGSGLGQLARDMARQVGGVVGVERSDEQLREARRLADEASETHLVEFRAGDATRLPLREDEWGCFDIAHTRFLLEHVADPVAVVREMVRAVKPGGRIILQDDSHDVFRMWPEPPGFFRLWQAYQRAFDRAGYDPVIGHRLVSLLAEAGAEPRRNTWLFFGSCAGHPDLGYYTANLIGVIEGLREPILAMGEYDRASFDRCLQEIRVWSERRDAAMWYAVSYAEGTRPLT